MLKLAPITLLALIVAGSLEGQEPIERHLGNVTELDLHTQHGWRARIHNQDTSAIVAMDGEWKCGTKEEHNRYGTMAVVDTLYSYGTEPIAPGAYYAIAYSSNSFQCPGGINAVLFEDGRTLGEPGAVEEIFDRRRGIADGLDYALPLLEQVLDQSLTPERAAADVKQHAEVIRFDKSMSMAKKDGEIFILLSTARRFVSELDFLVPSDLKPKRGPSTRETMTQLGVPQEQAHAMVMKRKMLEWRADLEGHLSP